MIFYATLARLIQPILSRWPGGRRAFRGSTLCDGRLGNARLPKDPELDLSVLREAGASEEFLQGIKRAGDLFSKLTEMRNGVGHFLLHSGQHVYVSDANAYGDYSLASHVLLRAATQAISDLQGFYGTHVESKTRIGSVAPDRQRAHEFIVRDPELWS